MTETAPCQKCDREIATSAERCPECGYEPYKWRKKANLTPKEKPCASCEELVPVSAIECPSCGYRRGLLFRGTGGLLMVVGLLGMLTVIGIPLGVLLLALGVQLRTAGSFWKRGTATEATAANA